MKRHAIDWNRKLLKDLGKATGITQASLKNTIIDLSEDIGYELPKSKRIKTKSRIKIHDKIYDKIYSSEYYKKNKDVVLSKCREHYVAHKVKILEKKKESYSRKKEV